MMSGSINTNGVTIRIGGHKLAQLPRFALRFRNERVVPGCWLDQWPARPGEPSSAMHPEKGLCRSAGATPPSREFRLNPRPDASQAIRPRLFHRLTFYPEPALPPAGAELFPVSSPCFSNSSRALSRVVLIVNLKFG